MRIDLIKCMIDILERHQQVALPGLGSLYISRSNASIKEDKIYPPNHIVKFREKIGDISVFVEYLSENYDLSTVNAEKVLKKFTQRLINRLVNYNEVLLPNIGILKNGGSSPIKLIEDESGINFYKNYLPVLDLKRVIKPTPEVINKATEILAVKEREVDEILGTIVQSSEESESSSAMQIEVASKPWWYDWWPFIGLFLLLAILLLLSKTCAKETPIIEDETVTSIDPVDTIQSELPIYDPEKLYLESELDLIPQEILESGCVIVVGSFSKARNAVKMVDLIESQGYNSYSAVNEEGLTRTGIVFNCMDEDLIAFIQEIRAEISPKAWYLQPKLHIEYAQ